MNRKLNILVDIVHPAHVHFYKHMINWFIARGHAVSIVGRDKDVTQSLLRHYSFHADIIGRSGHTGMFGQAMELVKRVIYLAKVIKKENIDIVLTRNPAGAQSAKLMGKIGIFDTDDGLAAGIHFKAARPFATYITTPDCLDEDYGENHIKYPGYKQSAYLHPNQFKPDEKVLDLFDLDPGERFFLVRFVAMNASHDTGESGLSFEDKVRLIQILRQHGKVFISSEGGLPAEWRDLKIQIPSHYIHDALAFCNLFVGDSQTMAAEAAVLGTPNLRVSSFAKRISYLNELEKKYQLTFGLLPSESDRFFDKLNYFLERLDDPSCIKNSTDRLFEEKEDIAKWYIDFVEKVAEKHLKK